jgi:rfaE bifunctional protein kinase chain/domain
LRALTPGVHNKIVLEKNAFKVLVIKMKEKHTEIVDTFKDKKIGIIGDVMLDHFAWGDIERISPEAPIPVVKLTKETFLAGGAGNTAVNIAQGGGRAFLVGVVGDDSEGKSLSQVLEKHNIDLRGLVRSKKAKTICKTRVVARGQHMLRIDSEDVECITDAERKKALVYIERHIKDWDGIIISDYLKGLLTPALVKSIIRVARKHKKFVIGDSKSADTSHFKGITVMTPNKNEVLYTTGERDVLKAGRKIASHLGCVVLVTLGEEGMILFEKNKSSHLHSKAKEVFDVTGAGDTVAAIFTLAFVGGNDFHSAAEIANVAAGIVVGKRGTAYASPGEIKKLL